jgi:hypothetical protein
MATPKAPNRAQLASFLKDNESIIRFQQLFEQAGQTIPDQVVDINAQLALVNDQLEELEFLIMTRSTC